MGLYCQRFWRLLLALLLADMPVCFPSGWFWFLWVAGFEFVLLIACYCLCCVWVGCFWFVLLDWCLYGCFGFGWFAFLVFVFGCFC